MSDERLLNNGNSKVSKLIGNLEALEAVLSLHLDELPREVGLVFKQTIELKNAIREHMEF